MNTLIKREYDYALRICAYLASHFNQRLVPISRIASLLYLSRPFTTKIVYRLKSQNIIGTVQGKDGGVYLTQPPDQTSVFDVLLAMGFDSRLNECLAEGHHCPMEDNCHLHTFFEEQERQLLEKFKSKTLLDVAFYDAQLKSAKPQSE